MNPYSKLVWRKNVHFALFLTQNLTFWVNSKLHQWRMNLENRSFIPFLHTKSLKCTKMNNLSWKFLFIFIFRVFGILFVYICDSVLFVNKERVTNRKGNKNTFQSRMSIKMFLSPISALTIFSALSTKQALSSLKLKNCLSFGFFGKLLSIK